MSNRRDFLKGAAGVVFTSCGILDQRLAAQPPFRSPKKTAAGGRRQARQID